MSQHSNIGEISNRNNKNTFFNLGYLKNIGYVFDLNPVAGTCLFTCVLGGDLIDYFFKKVEEKSLADRKESPANRNYVLRICKTLVCSILYVTLHSHDSFTKSNLLHLPSNEFFCILKR